VLRARVVVSLALAACSDDATTAPDAAVAIDAAIDGAPGGLATTCTGACATTSLTATLAATRTFDLAYYGVNATGTLHVEVYKGMQPGCPTMTSPTPDYTLILGAVPAPVSTAAVTSPGNVLDYKGDLLGGPLGKPATSVMITPAAYRAGMFVALDATLGFDTGIATGHVYATHCASLDD
jgi:hypothetical protein